MFTVLLSCLQGSPLKDEPCSSSQHIPRTSGTRRCRGGDGTCGASAASSGDSFSSSAPPARRALPGQGKAPFYLHLSGVSSTHEGKAHPLRGRNRPVWLSGLVRRWKKLSQGSQGSAALCWLFALSLKALRGNVPALFNSMQGHKDTLGFLSGRVKSSSGPELFRNYYCLLQAHPS